MSSNIIINNSTGDFSATQFTTGNILSGKIIQIISGSTTTPVTVNTATYTDTGLTATITPTSSSNNILVIVQQNFSASRSTASTGLGITLYRDATNIYQSLTDGNPFGFDYGIGGAGSLTAVGNHSIHIVDSPSTTSPIVYKTQGRPKNQLNSGSVTFQISNLVSVITLIELKP